MLDLKTLSSSLLLCFLALFSCDNCTPQLEIRNATNKNYTVYYDSPSALSFGVGPMDTVSFGVGDKKERIVRIVIWGSNLTKKRDTVSIDCDETYAILLETP